MTLRAQKKPTSTPPSAQVLRRSISVQETLALPDRGSGGRQRGLGGHENFADRDFEKNGRVFFFFESGPVLKAPVLGSSRDSQGVLCATYGRYVHFLEVMWARYEGRYGIASFLDGFSTVYSPEAPLCPPLCQTPATIPASWPRRCLMVALWWPGRAPGLRCGLLTIIIPVKCMPTCIFFPSQ